MAARFDNTWGDVPVGDGGRSANPLVVRILDRRDRLGKLEESLIYAGNEEQRLEKNEIILNEVRCLQKSSRDAFMLNFISDPELRRTINVTTNISENWNEFVKWAAFGGGHYPSQKP